MKSLTHKIMEALAIYGSRTVITPAVAEDLQEAMKLSALKIVPREPTQAMIWAGVKALNFGITDDTARNALATDVYKTMVGTAE